MSAKKRRFDTRTILIALLIAVIIAAVYVWITNLPPEENTLTPGEVLDNQVHYLNGESIIVKGLYDRTAEGDVIVSTMDTTTTRDELRVDLTSATGDIPAVQGEKYKFKGILTRETPLDPITLVAENIERV
jgi:hypothetical protein